MLDRAATPYSHRGCHGLWASPGRCTIKGQRAAALDSEKQGYGGWLLPVDAHLSVALSNINDTVRLKATSSVLHRPSK